MRESNVIHQKKGNHNKYGTTEKKPTNGSILPILTSSSIGIVITMKYKWGNSSTNVDTVFLQVGLA